ncbi:MAG: hypothetical protein GX801_00075 [Fibrobacter sp.]|nr:hypothetical protein [Fibrobacter sp.]
MQTPIVARVAEFIRNPEARKSAERSAPAQAQVDRVVLSQESLAKSKDLLNAESNWEKERIVRVNKVTEQVQNNRYRISPAIEDQIALKIVSLL